VRERIEAAVQKKVEGQEITMATARSGAQVIDLMEALRASLERACEESSARKSSGEESSEEISAPVRRAGGEKLLRLRAARFAR